MKEYQQKIVKEFEERFKDPDTESTDTKLMIHLNHKAFVIYALRGHLDLLSKEIEGMKEEQPHIHSIKGEITLPIKTKEADLYMYSLTQFNRVAGKNQALSDIQSLLK